MEEVWNDISLASLPDCPSRDRQAPSATFRDLTFQDFLSRKGNNNNPSPTTVDYGSPAASTPATSLCLNSGPDQFNPLTNASEALALGTLPDSHQISNSGFSLNTVSFNALASSSSLQGLGKMRFPESDSGSSDRRHKRMIKNRESAARSRARKQAYTNELELKVAHLTAENARLKRQQQQFCSAAAAEVPRKHTLHRTSTAPF